MNKRNCKNCKWHDDFSWDCFNWDSLYCADFTDEDFSCDFYEFKEVGTNMELVINLAKYIVTKCENDGIPITNLQLQQILYCIEKEFLMRKNKPLFIDNIEAWEVGAVVPDVYYHFCGFGAMPITTKYDVKIEKDVQKFIDSIIENKRKLEPWELFEENNATDGAWDTTYRNGEGKRNTIKISLIRDECKRK